MSNTIVTVGEMQKNMLITVFDTIKTDNDNSLSANEFGMNFLNFGLQNQNPYKAFYGAPLQITAINLPYISVSSLMTMAQIVFDTREVIFMEINQEYADSLKRS